MIISCSRRTDIPAFYSDWFFNRLREGYVSVRNPMNSNQVRNVSLAPADVDCIVFWTKDPTPMLDRLHLLQDYKYYFQFTITPYGKDIEPNLPSKMEIIDTFLKLSDKTGKERIIWRYDPILLSAGINIDYHWARFHDLAGQLAGRTEKCVISFIDMYRHIRGRMADDSVRPPDVSEMRELAEHLSRIAQTHQMKVATCAEKIDLADSGIEHGKCIDDHQIAELTGEKLKIAKDKYQREFCGCVASIDIGEYNTCRHGCRYCYANVNQKKIEKSRFLHYSY
jgi:DNA repair photolyase